MRAKTIFVALFICNLLNCIACGGNDLEPESELTPPLPLTPTQPSDTAQPNKPGDIILRFLNHVDSVEVETNAEFKLSIERKNYTGKFKVEIDTICPVFEIITMENGVAQQNIKKGCEIRIDGKLPTKPDSLALGEHTVTISNPSVVGEYEIFFTLTSGDGITHKESFKIKAFSAPAILSIYEVDPYLELEILDKNYYEVLNQNYTYTPLSQIFIGKRVDTIFIKEQYNPGTLNEHGEEWTFDGRGTTVYLGQKGGKAFYFNEGIVFDENYTVRPEWNSTTPSLTLQQQGFHCLDFWPFRKDGGTVCHKLGKTTYTIECFDYWGKKVSTNLTIVALDRNTQLPITGHRLPD